MSTSIPITYTASTLAAGLDTLLRQLALCRYAGKKLVRVQVRVETQDILQWLSCLPSGNRCYFSLRDQSLALAGIGAALELKATAPATIPALFAQAEQVVKGSDAYWVGGCSFSGRSGAYQWREFPGARFVLPLIEIRQQRGLYYIAFNLYAESFAQWQEQQLSIHSYCRQLAYTEMPELQPVRIESRRNSVGAELWQQQVEEALAQIKNGDLQKVVLAREVALELSNSPNPMLILAALEAANPECYTFAVETDSKCFIGCSPERLLSRKENAVETEALAGTVRRGATETEDKALERILREDPKLTHEHKLVAKAIKESLEPVTAHLEDSEPVKILKLNRIQHRCQPLSATVSATTANSDLYRCLHPTPAICGYPSHRAQAFINEIEQLCRGWYSGSVGILGDKYCELSVAIRSALVDNERLWLYSGVGIVAGSIAEQEWHELESKLEAMLQAIGNNALAIDYNAH